MADSVFHTFGRWAAAALCAVAVSLVHAQPPHGPRAGFAAPAGAAVRRGHSMVAMSADPYRRGAPRAAPAPSAPRPATPFRPVSEQAQNLSREGGAAYLRAGSIRADIARYNEERGGGRQQRAQNSGARSSESPPVYRN